MAHHAQEGLAEEPHGAVRVRDPRPVRDRLVDREGVATRLGKLAQGVLAAFPRRDLHDAQVCARDPARGVPDGVGAQQERPRPATGRDAAGHLEVAHALARRHDMLERPAPVARERRDHFVDPGAETVDGGRAGHRFEGRVPVEDAQVAVQHGETHGRGLDELRGRRQAEPDEVQLGLAVPPLDAGHAGGGAAAHDDQEGEIEHDHDRGPHRLVVEPRPLAEEPEPGRCRNDKDGRGDDTPQHRAGGPRIGQASHGHVVGVGRDQRHAQEPEARGRRQGDGDLRSDLQPAGDGSRRRTPAAGTSRRRRRAGRGVGQAR